MTLAQLRSFIAIAQAGSFTGASAVVGVTQSGLSQALAGLETTLGVRLLVRQRHGVELTAFGERVLDHARAAFRHLEDLRYEAVEAAGAQSGSLRIAAFPSAFATVLPPLLRRFRARHPGVKLVSLETDVQEIENWLRDGVIDLGVVLNPAPESEAIPLGQDAWVGILPLNHHLVHCGTLSLAKLAAEPFVLGTGGCHVHGRALAEMAAVPLSDVQIEVRDWVSAIALVREGLGVGIVPESALPNACEDVHVVRLDPPAARHFGLLPTNRRKSSKAAELLMELARHLS